MDLKEKTENTIDELLLRLFASDDAICNYLYLKAELSDINFGQSEYEKNFKDSLSDMVIQYALIQINSIFDQSGVFSFSLNNGLVSQNRLKKLFPALSEDEITSLKSELDAVLKLFENDITLAKSIRGNIIAHMKERRATGTEDWDGLINYHSHKSLGDLNLENLLRMTRHLARILSNYW